MSKILVIILLAFFHSCQVAPTKHNPENKTKVVLISIDGFRPDFYLSDKFTAPTLKRLAKEGRYATGMQSVFPSVTYPNHTTLVTGKRPAEHGILSNTRFTWESGPTTEWYWDSTYIQTKTLWDILHENELSTASIHWPVTQYANIDYLIPEIFYLPPWNTDKSFNLVIKNSTKGLPEEINKALKLKPYTNMKEADEWGAKAFNYLYKSYSPDFMAFHIIYADKNQHETGRDSLETKNAVEWIDGKIASIVEGLGKKTCLLITGDHGFINYDKAIHINKLFREQGWILYDDKAEKLISWRVIAHKSGGQAAIYVKDKSLEEKVIKLLKKNQKLGYKFISRKELKQHKSYPEATAAISAIDGFSIGSSFKAPIVEKLNKTQGQHGQLPDQKKMHTGFIAHNCSLKQGPITGVIKNTQVAPTILGLFGIGDQTEDYQGINL